MLVVVVVVSFVACGVCLVCFGWCCFVVCFSLLFGMSGMGDILGLRTAPPSKKTKKETKEPGAADMHQLLTNVARLSLANAAGLRQVRAASMRTFLLPTKSDYVSAGKAAGAQFAAAAAARAGIDSLPPPFALVFAALLQTLAKDVMTPADVRPRIEQLLASATTPKALNGVFRVCKLSKCFSPDKHRVELAFAPDWQWLGEVFAQIWSQQGGTECFGQAPRGPLERTISQVLGQK